jgi:hypothetical protein
VGGDIGQFVRAEQELVRYDVGGDLLGPGEVSVGTEIAVRVIRLEFEANILSALVIESVQPLRRSIAGRRPSDSNSTTQISAA